MIYRIWEDFSSLLSFSVSHAWRGPSLINILLHFTHFRTYFQFLLLVLVTNMRVSVSIFYFTFLAYHHFPTIARGTHGFRGWKWGTTFTGNTVYFHLFFNTFMRGGWKCSVIFTTIGTFPYLPTISCNKAGFRVLLLKVNTIMLMPWWTGYVTLV